MLSSLQVLPIFELFRMRRFFVDRTRSTFGDRDLVPQSVRLLSRGGAYNPQAG